MLPNEHHRKKRICRKTTGQKTLTRTSGSSVTGLLWPSHTWLHQYGRITSTIRTLYRTKRTSDGRNYGITNITDHKTNIDEHQRMRFCPCSSGLIQPSVTGTLYYANVVNPLTAGADYIRVLTFLLAHCLSDF